LRRDGQGRITKITDPRGVAGEAGTHAVEYVYNAAGDLVEVKDRLGQTTRYSYRTVQGRGHILEQAFDSLNSRAAFAEYNADGRPSKLTDADTRATRLEYTVEPGPNGRREQRIVPPGPQDTEAERTATLKFDPRGNVTEARVAYGRNGQTLLENVTQAQYQA